MKTTSHFMSLTIFELGWNVLEVLWIWGSGDVEMSHTNRPSLEKEMNTVYSVLLLGCRAGGHLQPQEWISVTVFNGVFHIFDECPGIPVMWPSRKKATPKPSLPRSPGRISFRAIKEKRDYLRPEEGIYDCRSASKYMECPLCPNR